MTEDFDRWEAITEYGAARMRELCTERGIDWNRLTEDASLQLIDTILHENMNRAMPVTALASLFKETQALPQVLQLTQAQIEAEVAAYRSGK